MKISVCMATFNGEKYLKEQLESILSQLNEGDEVIVSDDGSTDDTVRIICEYNDSRVRLFFNKNEKGYTKNFEYALSKASGDVIFLADQDDVWLNNKVDIVLDKLKTYDFVVSDNTIVDRNLNILSESHFKEFRTQKGFLRNFIFPRYVGACMAFNRNVLDKSLPFPSGFKLCAHDYWISLISEMYFSVCKLDTPLILYRRHGDNASSGGVKSTNSLSHKLKVRVYTLYKLLQRGMNVF